MSAADATAPAAESISTDAVVTTLPLDPVPADATGNTTPPSDINEEGAIATPPEVSTVQANDATLVAQEQQQLKDEQAADAAAATGTSQTTLQPTEEEQASPGDETRPKWHFTIGFVEDTNRRWRRTMEDAHAAVDTFGDLDGQGFFGVYDGHAGKQVADYCGKHLHEIFLEIIRKHPHLSIPEAFDKAFTSVDNALVAENLGDAGCTAISAFVRNENEDGSIVASDQRSATTKRHLYTANVGDARAVLCRGGEAIRLSYDHKGSDESEVRRIVDAGGFVFNERVNGILAVTRSIGDMPMKEFIVSNPYTTATVLTDQDTFLILACDGVWDVISDQEAVEMIQDVMDPQEAAQRLLSSALEKFTTDNLSVLVIRFID